MARREDRPSEDFLSRVHEVCRLQWRTRGETDVEIEELESKGLSYLKVSYVRGPWTKHDLVGVHEGALTEDVVRSFALFRSKSGNIDVQLVHNDDPVPRQLADLADRWQIWLRHFHDYQQALWDHSDYVARQTNDLLTDVDYPLNLHVDKRWALLGGDPDGDLTAVPHLLDRLDTAGPRFVLVLGDFGTGKTFLLHKLAHDLAERGKLVPVLVTMRDLEKGRSLDELIAQHMSRANVDPFHGSAFRYLLREGRVALLFDGFDELALRTSYERVPQHFRTLREAAAGAAKVVVTSRHQYFATDHAVRNALGDDVTRLRGSHIIRLFALEAGQRRELVLKAFEEDEAATDEFLAVLDSVPNLMDLATNPRMLTFMIRWYRQGILTADTLARSVRGQAMTAGDLYELLLTTWLKHEVNRQSMSGGLRPLSVEQRMDALRETAMLMWRSGQRSVLLSDLGEVADRISDLARLEMRHGEAAQAVGSSTVLVRRGEDEFSFIHQSVMEWFVADTARRALNAGGVAGADDVLSDHELTAPMVDFLCDLTGTGRVLEWARDVVGRDGTSGLAAKANAALVLQRRNAQADDINYTGQDLRGRDLSGQDLTGANLSGADLSGAVLPTSMQRVDLRGTKLVGARLVDADLTDAILVDADLSQAHLMGADLTGADLRRACLDRAVLIGATVTDEALALASTDGAALPDMEVVAQVAGFSATTTGTPLPSNLVITGHADGTLRVRDFASMRTLRILSGHEFAVRAVVSDGRRVISVDGQGVVLRWDMHDWNSRHVAGDAQPDSSILKVAAGGDVVALARPGVVQLRSSVTGSTLREIDTGGTEVSALAIDPEGRRLAIATGGNAMLIDLVAGEADRPLSGNRGLISRFYFDPDGQWLYSIGLKGASKWRLASGEVATSFSSSPSVAAATRRWFAAVEGEVITVQPSAGGPATVMDTRSRDVTSLVAGPDGEWLMSGHANGAVRFWDPPTGRLLGIIQDDTYPVVSLAGGPDGLLAAANKSAGGVVWDLFDGKQATVLPPAEYSFMGVSGRVLFSNTTDGVLMWDIDDRGILRQRKTLSSMLGKVSKLAVGRGGMTAAYLRDDKSRVTTVNFANREERIFDQLYAVFTMAFDARGRWLALDCYNPVILVWVGGFWRYRRQFYLSTNGAAIAFRPGGRSFLVTSDSGVIAVTSPTNYYYVGLRYSEPGSALVVDPAGKWFAVGGKSGSLQVVAFQKWEQLVATAHAHSSSVDALTVDPGGKWLASGGADGAVRIWHPTTGELKMTLVNSPNGWAVLLPDGRFRVEGQPENVWWSAGLCRFDAADLDALASYTSSVRRLGEGETVDLGG